jgi:hypothetical protein
MRRIIPLLIGLAFFAGCETPLPPEFRPDSRPQAAWEKQLERLDCHYYRYTLAVRSRDPLVFAIMGNCLGGGAAGKKPGLGYYWLISVDAGRNEVQATRIASNSAGGLHYTASGDLMWFSSAGPTTPSGGEPFVEVFTASAGTVQERSLGRLDTPFRAVTPSISEGEGCHVLMTAGSHASERGPHEYRHWLMRDEDPINSAKVVEGFSRVLYWNPVGKYFVTQAPKLDRKLNHSRLSCSGEVSPLPPDEAARLATVTDTYATYLALADGTLVAANKSGEEGTGQGTELLVFREGRSMERIGPFSVDLPPCPDLACEPLGLSAFLMGASPSGRHFVVCVLFLDMFLVYRVGEDKSVRRWSNHLPFDRYIPVMIDDNTAMQLEARGPVSYYSW